MYASSQSMCVIWKVYDVRSSLIQALHHHHHHQRDGDFKSLHVLLSIHLISFFCIPQSVPFTFFSRKLL